MVTFFKAKVKEWFTLIKFADGMPPWLNKSMGEWLSNKQREDRNAATSCPLQTSQKQAKQAINDSNTRL